MTEPVNAPVPPTEPNPAPAPAGTPAPVAPPPPAVNLSLTPEPIVPPAPAQPPAEPEVKFEPTGDVKMDIALAFFAKAGLKPGDEAVKLAQTGDFTLLKAHLSASGKAGWAEHVALAEQSFAEVSTAAKATADKVQAAVLGVFGGAEQWAEVQAWAREAADPDEAEQINAMFKAGPTQAKAAAVYLKQCFEAAGKAVTKQGAPALADHRTTPEPRGSDALGPKEFAKAVQELTRTHGSRAVDNNIPEYQALVRRRQAFRP